MDSRIYEIIAEMITGQPVHETDNIELQRWLKESAEHRELFERFIHFYEQGENIRQSVGINHELAYQKICRVGHIRAAGVIRRKRLWKLSGIAAAVVLMMGIAGAVLWNISGESDGKEVVYLSQTTGKVKLKLQNGQCLDLVGGGKQVVASETGQIAICDSNTLNYQSVALAGKNTTMEYNTLTVPAGAEYCLVLSDGTRVYMNAVSELYYPTVFMGERREVVLKGEAYFEVTRDTARQFIVRAGGIDVQVLGTSFNLSAYEDAGRVTATLVSGKIRALSDGKTYDIVPGEQFRKNVLNGKIEIEKVNTELFTCWKDGYYYFEDCPLEDIMQTLRRWYGIEAVFTNPGLKNIEFTGRLRRYEDVGELFRKFEQTRNVSFSRKGNTVIVNLK